MGRTIPSFRLASGEEEREWKVFRNALDKSDRRIFDAANPIRVRPISMSIILHHYKKLMRLSKKIK